MESFFTKNMMKTSVIFIKYNDVVTMTSFFFVCFRHLGQMFLLGRGAKHRKILSDTPTTIHLGPKMLVKNVPFLRIFEKLKCLILNSFKIYRDKTL